MSFATMEKLLGHYRDRPSELIAAVRTFLGPPVEGCDDAGVLLAARIKYHGSGTREQAEDDLERFLQTGDLPLCCGRFLLE